MTPNRAPLSLLVAWVHGWRTGCPVQGRWYWVTDGGHIWPAIADDKAVGGWSNEDTWEDFDYQVVAWKPIPMPRTPPAFSRSILKAQRSSSDRPFDEEQPPAVGYQPRRPPFVDEMPPPRNP